MAKHVPDFIIIGTMKSATSTLFSWLSEVPGIELPAVKEPAFFSDDEVWAKGYDWYKELFPQTPAATITGESSVVYSDPQHSPTAAERISKTLPNVRIVCLLRDPVDRLRSNYRHEVRRHRESRPFLEAIADPSTAYVRRSQYDSALRPYFEQFEPEQVLVVSMSDTVTLPFSGWYRILSHLGVPAVPPRGTAVNVTTRKPRFSWLALQLWERGFLTWASKHSPPWIRRIGRQAVMYDTAEYRRLFASADAPVPPSVLNVLRHEVHLLETRLGQSFGFRST